MIEICKGIDEIDEVGQKLLTLVGKDSVVVLKGDLAAGKTTLVKSVASLLGVTEGVTSPTFSLQQCYSDKIFHYDIYNHGLEQFMSLGLFEELEKKGLHFIEWGDDKLIELLENAGFDLLAVEIEKNQTKRCYTMRKIG